MAHYYIDDQWNLIKGPLSVEEISKLANEYQDRYFSGVRPEITIQVTNNPQFHGAGCYEPAAKKIWLAERITEFENTSIASAFEREIFGPMKREIGRIEQAAPAFANHGTNLACSVFARVIVGPLAEAQCPELEHLWVLSHHEPASGSKEWESYDSEKTEPSEESHHANHHDHEPGRKVDSELFARLVQGLVDRKGLSSLGHLHG